MNRLALLSVILSLAIQLSGQDMFPARQLTFDPAQDGFATWSPDSRFIVYQHSDMGDTISKNGLWKVTLDGKEARQIFNELAEHPKWSPDGKNIVFDADTGKSIKMIPAEGGLAIRFLSDTVIIQNGGLPHWSPDGSQIAFIERKNLSLCIYNFSTNELKSIFSQQGMLPLPAGWWSDGNSILVALMDRQTRKSSILRISVDGSEKKLVPVNNENFYRHLALSPDGSLLVYAAMTGRYLGLFVMPSEGGASQPLAVTEGSHNEGAIWSPDGKHIAFNSTRSGNHDIWIMDVNIRHIKRKLKTLNR